MEAKITEAQAMNEINLANSTAGGVAGVARAIQARETLLRWAELPADRFDPEHLLAAVRNAGDHWRS